MPPPIERDERQFGKYRLIAHIASGGMAEIYIASHAQLAGFEKIVVLKRMLPRLQEDPVFVEMFLEEARTAARLNHPNTVQIFELGQIEDRYFIAMEYLAGENLASVISAHARARKRFPAELAAGIVMQAAEGLHHAHTLKGDDGRPLQLIHRDISPPNIFVLYDGGVKVVDFGVAKHAARLTKTRVGVLKGKVGYMSPEQIVHDEVDARSDIFSLGVVLWECLTCRKLFRGNEYESLRAIADTDAPSPRTVYEKIPVLLERVALKALARDRDQRYQTAAELRADLASYLRASAAEADTVAIGGFMMQLFADRAEKKQALFLRAKVGLDSPDEMSDSVWAGPEGQETPSVPQKTPEPSGPTVIPLAAESLTLAPEPDDAEGFVVMEPTVRAPIPFFSDAEALAEVPTAETFLDQTPVVEAAADAPQSELPRPPQRSHGRIVAFASIAGLVVGLGLLLYFLRAGDARPAPDPGGLLVVQASSDAAVAEEEPEPDAQPDAAAPGGSAPDSGAPDTQPEQEQRRPDAALPDTSAVQQTKPSAPRERSRGRRASSGRSNPGKDRPADTLRYGRLRLQTSPWTIIYYQGKRLGESPLIDVELPAGKLTLRAVNASEGIDVPIKVEIKPDQRTAKNVNLR